MWIYYIHNFRFSFETHLRNIFQRQPSISCFVLYILNVSSYFIKINVEISVETNKEDTESVYKRITEIALKLTKRLVQDRDVMILVIAATEHCMARSSSLNLIYLGEITVVDVTYGAHIVMAVELMTFAGGKHAIGKRVRYIKSAEEYTDLVEHISITRQLHCCNKTLDNTYGL